MMKIKVKLIDRKGWTKIEEVKAQEVEKTTLFGETITELIPSKEAQRIVVPFMSTPRIGVKASEDMPLGGFPQEEHIQRKDFYFTGKKDQDGFFTYEEM